MPEPDTNAPLEQRIEQGWQALHGGSVSAKVLRRLSAGASSHTFVVELTTAAGVRRCVTQLDSGTEPFVSALTKDEQAAVQQAAFAAGVKTPEVLLTLQAGAGQPAGFVTPFLEGETMGQRIVSSPALAAARSHLVEQCAQALFSIHALPPEALSFLPERTARTQLSELFSEYEQHCVPRPVFDVGFAWLRDHLPDSGRLFVVHGDFRNGNLIVGPQGLVAVLDWELSHLGDPLEDLGWMCVRSWRFGRPDLAAGGFGSKEALCAAYVEAAGRSVDEPTITFWQMLGTLKWGLLCDWFARQRLTKRVDGLEPAAIGRRVSEVELQVLDLLQRPGGTAGGTG